MQTSKKLRWCVLFLGVWLGVIGVGNMAGEIARGPHRHDWMEFFGSFFVAVVPAGLLLRYARILRRTEGAESSESPALRAQLAVALYFVGMAAIMMLFVAAAAAYTVYGLFQMGGAVRHEERPVQAAPAN
jgi:hypothetical protein